MPITSESFIGELKSSLYQKIAYVDEEIIEILRSHYEEFDFIEGFNKETVKNMIL